jgi:glycosyltransferase involved in cell wall biosynthesis
MKIALLFRSFGPYHLARLRAAREHHSVLALEVSDVDEDYGWSAGVAKRAAGVITLPSTAPKSARSELANTLSREIAEFAPDAVAIPGYSEAFALTVLRTCRALGIPAILMSDTHAGSARQKTFHEIVKKRLVSLYHAALVAGSPHAEYLVGLGFPREKIALGYDVIDNGHFSPDDDLSPAKIDVGHPLNPTRHFFCCARFVQKKNLSLLIEAFVRYRYAAHDGGWELVIAGEGPLRDALEQQTAATPFAAHIHLIGHKTYEELPALYRAAGAFILPSVVEEWGLVVNEAMAAGLPVLVSKHAGCRRDLVEDGINGFTFDPANPDELAAQMRLMTTSARRDDMARASRRIIARWDVNRFASGLAQAAEAARQRQPQRYFPVGAAFAAALSHRV